MCSICERLDSLKAGKDPYLIKEFEHSFFVLGDHQYFKGYGQVIMKDHFEDLTDVDLETQGQYMNEVFLAARFLKKIYKPVRINYSCLGNFVPHIHFHLFPRYEEDLENDATKNPWHCMDEFSKFALNEEEARVLASDLQAKFYPIITIELSHPSSDG